MSSASLADDLEQVGEDREMLAQEAVEKCSVAV
jgi:hypothetical protein